MADKTDRSGADTPGAPNPDQELAEQRGAAKQAVEPQIAEREANRARRSAHDSSLPGFLGTIDSAISRIESVMLAVGVLLMALNTISNVVGRFVFQSSIFFSEELNRILIILITFAGISYAARQGRHIRMSAIYDTMRPRMRKLMMIVIALVTAVFMLGLCYYTIGYIETQASRGRVLPALQIPVWWTLVWVPVGFLMTGLQYLLTAIKNITEKDIYLSTNLLEGYESDEQEV